jgi:hypothetical protein
MLTNFLLAACFSCVCQIGGPLREVVVPGLPPDMHAYQPALGHLWYRSPRRWVWIERDVTMKDGEVVAYCWGAKMVEVPEGLWRSA